MGTLFEQAVKGNVSGSYTEQDTGFLDFKEFGHRTPSYMIASDTLSAANGNETLASGFASNIDSIQKFITVSTLSGANQLYNIPASVGNMFGMENELSRTEDVLSSLDSDYSAFYAEHKESTDLVGFLVSSMIPGTAGVKVLNAGQRALQGAMIGKAGGNISKAMGLLTPKRKALLDAAVDQVKKGTAPATLANKDAIKAIGAGFGQGALEAAAFEVAIATTMHDSPILEHQDFGDFVSNVAWGAGVFGTVFAAVDAAKINSALKKAADGSDLAARPWTHRRGAADTSASYEKIAIYSEDMHTTPPLPPETDMQRLSFLRSAFQAKVMSINNAIRTEFGNLAKNDTEVAEVMYRGFMGRSREAKIQNILGVESTSRMGVQSKAVREWEALQREHQTGLVDLDPSPEMKAFIKGDVYVSYLKTYGDDMGNVYKDTAGPVLTRNIDRAGEQGLEITSAGVRVSSNEMHAFDMRGNLGQNAGSEGMGMWNIVGKNKWEVDARYEWAAHIDPLLPRMKKGKQLAIHQDDIPMLEKLYFEDPNALKIPGVKIVGDEIGTRVDVTDMARATGLQEFIAERKLFHINRLAKGELNKDGSIFKSYTQEEIASITNMRMEPLNGVLENSSVSTFTDRDIFARASYAEDYTLMLKKSGILKEGDDVVSLSKVPQHIRMVTNVSDIPIKEIDNNFVRAVEYLQSKQKIYQDGLNRAAASPLVLGGYYDMIPDIGGDIVRNSAVVSGSGPRLVSAASANYGSLANWVEQTGKVADNAIHTRKNITDDVFAPSAYAALHKPESAVEFAVINNKLQQYPVEFVLDDAGTGLVAGPLKNMLMI